MCRYTVRGHGVQECSMPLCLCKLYEKERKKERNERKKERNGSRGAGQAAATSDRATLLLNNS